MYSVVQYIYTNIVIICKSCNSLTREREPRLAKVWPWPKRWTWIFQNRVCNLVVARLVFFHSFVAFDFLLKSLPSVSIDILNFFVSQTRDWLSWHWIFYCYTLYTWKRGILLAGNFRTLSIQVKNVDGMRMNYDRILEK